MRQHLGAARPFAVLQQQAVPGRRHFLLLAPVEDDLALGLVAQMLERARQQHGLLAAGRFDRRAPVGARSRPLPERTHLGDHQRALPALRAHAVGHGMQRLAVGVDAEHLDAGRQLAQLLDLVGAGFGKDGDGGMLRIALAHQPGGLLDRRPDGGGIRQLGLDLVADAPHQQGRVVLVAVDEFLELLHQRSDLGRIAVVEAAARMLHPEAGDHLQPVLLRLVEHEAGFVAIGADGVGAELFEQPHAALAGRALHDEGLAVDQDAIALDGDLGDR